MLKAFSSGMPARKNPPKERPTKLFEANNERFAVLRNITILRSIDLYCITLLRLLGKLDASGFWQRCFSTNGSFDAEEYWKVLPDEYQVQ
jgi:hypothetical protein